MLSFGEQEATTKIIYWGGLIISSNTCRICDRCDIGSNKENGFGTEILVHMRERTDLAIDCKVEDMHSHFSISVHTEVHTYILKRGTSYYSELGSGGHAL